MRIKSHPLTNSKQGRVKEPGADYLGFGPIFGSTTKDAGYSARGLDMLREIRAAVKIPIVAIGGINEQNVAEVWKAGADSAAIISDLLTAENVTEKVKRIFTMRHVL
jgi:thiamine-phosphate diphosphorylase